MSEDSPEPEEDPQERTADELFDADPNCHHKIVFLWSGVECSKCRGWFCY